MSASRRLVKIGAIALGVVAFGAGLAVGGAGCGDCDCGGVESVATGTLEIIGADERPELVGGLVEITDDEVTFHYGLDDGEWTVTYRITSRWPPDSE